MPYLRNNIPTNILYSAFGAKTLRTERTTRSCNDFRAFSKALLDRAQNQGGNTVVLERTLSEYFGVILRCFKSLMIRTLYSKILFLIK